MQAGRAPTIVKPSGSLNVERASALKDELSAALAEGDAVLVDLSSIEELDLSCLQVLYAAGLSAKAAGKALRFSGALPASIAKRLSSCGFLCGPDEGQEGLGSALVGF
jgi:anti-anti-sigma regulatory factor